MPHKTRPMTGLLVFMGLNLALVSTITPVYDFVCFHPYWERRRDKRRMQPEAAMVRTWIKIKALRCSIVVLVWLNNTFSCW